jgi:hypothetical protein
VPTVALGLLDRTAVVGGTISFDSATKTEAVTLTHESNMIFPTFRPVGSILKRHSNATFHQPNFMKVSWHRSTVDACCFIQSNVNVKYHPVVSSIRPGKRLRRSDSEVN